MNFVVLVLANDCLRFDICIQVADTVVSSVHFLTLHFALGLRSEISDTPSKRAGQSDHIGGCSDYIFRAFGSKLADIQISFIRLHIEASQYDDSYPRTSRGRATIGVVTGN
jgi:hypothetical protein